jgi:plasmid segregation protein ParM
METGIISLYNRITARMHADYDVLLEEADIDSIIQGKKGFYEEKVVRAVLQEANQCAL